LGVKKTGLSFTTAYSGLARSLHTQVDEVAAQLKLKPISKTLINTPSDKDVPSNIYLINIYLPNGIRIDSIHVLEGIPSGCDMLIGMDVISLSDFAITNLNGRTIFSFRMPSMTNIDFNKE